MIVGSGNGARPCELDDEAEEVEDDEGRRDVPWETPERLEIEGVGGARKPDDATKSHITGCCKEARG